MVPALLSKRDMPSNYTLQDSRTSQALGRAQQRAADAAERLASGRKRAADLGALLSLSDQLQHDARLATQAVRNANDTLSAARVGDRALSTVTENLDRLAELATTAANGTLSADQRAAVQREFDQRREEIDRVSRQTEFNGVRLLRGGETVAAEVGSGSSEQVAFTTVDASASGLGVAGASVATPDAAQAALDAITGAIDRVAQARADLGAAESRLTTSIRSRLVAREQALAADSRIADADVAEEAAGAVAAQIQVRSGVAVQAQANLQARQVLRLLQR